MNATEPVWCVLCSDLPRSVTHELTRLCGPQIVLGLVSQGCGTLVPLATARPWDALRDSGLQDDTSEMMRPIVVSSGVGVPSGDALGNASDRVFDASSPRSRLALLAYLAGRVAAGRRSGEPPQWLERPIHRRVAQVQCGLDLHLTEKSLVERLDIADSTLRQWFNSAGTVHCGHYLLCIRALVVARCLNGSAQSTEHVAAALGFRHVESMRRMLRRFGVDSRALRRSEGFFLFERTLKREIEGEQKQR